MILTELKALVDKKKSLELKIMSVDLNWGENYQLISLVKCSLYFLK